MRYSRYFAYKQVYSIFKTNSNKKAASILTNFIHYIINPFLINETPVIVNHSHKLYQGTVDTDDEKFNILVTKDFDTRQSGTYLSKLIEYARENDASTLWFDVQDSKYAPPEEEQFITDLNLKLADIYTCMYYPAHLWAPLQKKNPEIKIKKVESEAELEMFIDILNETFGEQSQDWDFYARFINPETNEHTLGEMFILYLNGEPASTGMIYFEDGISVIDDLSTKKAFTRKGLAKSMVNFLIKQAIKRKYKQIGLLATIQGIKMYQKIGFRSLNCYVREYIEATDQNNE